MSIVLRVFWHQKTFVKMLLAYISLGYIKIMCLFHEFPSLQFFAHISTLHKFCTCLLSCIAHN